MKRLIFSFLALIIIPASSFSQEIISGKSNVKRFNIEPTPTYERGLPPNLFVDLSFEDDNGNGILESNEGANLKLRIANKGKAKGLEVQITDNITDINFKIGNYQKEF